MINRRQYLIRRNVQFLDCGNDKLPARSKLVWDFLLQLGPYKFMGFDVVHPRILRELVVDVIARPFSIIFQWSLESGQVPVDWKLESVVPIFKKGTKEDPGNYKPIGLSTVPGKIMEKIIPGNFEKTS